MGEPCKCKLKCFEKATEEERQEVFFFEYWELGTSEGKWDFHINQLINSAKQRCTNNKESMRSMTREYSLDEKRVCKVIYLCI